MEMKTRGNVTAPALLLLPDGGVASAVDGSLRALEKNYFLLLPSFAEGESLADRAAALEECILDDFSGRIWGAYGLREGGTLLLSLLSRGKVRIRTSIAEGRLSLPEGSLKNCYGRLYYWYRAKDRKAKKLCKELRAVCPELHTLALKKLKKGTDFLSVRPDLMLKRLEKTFGKAQVLTVSSLMDGSSDSIWRQLARRGITKPMEQLTEMQPIERRDDEQVQILEGKTSRVSHWSHMIRLQRVSAKETIYTDQVELEAGFLTPLVKLWTGAYLRLSQKQQNRKLKKAR